MTDRDDTLIDRLSPRMRDCLRLIYDRKSSKEIAAALGVSPGTIDGYVAEAVRLLGARGRIDAAERLHAHEAGAMMPPGKPGPQSAGVAPFPLSIPTGLDSGSAERRWPLPIRTQGATGNDLGILQRIGWILAIAFGFALGLGAVADALRLVNRLAGGS